ncbi:LuxR C-terminal-related transcriptional regulator [Paenibacillus periandrae]|uniref:LuxR C-terminal-related transcriptional regulator n=1 Tax=Paenibacillus periandrae TaxID=1761741 RepID=UPI001F098FE7|nr:response regulator transcription factor [Paenibacillus periandrae]
MTEPIHVLLVSDHDICLNELASFLRIQPDFIIHPANIGKEAKRLLLQEPLSVGVLGFELITPFYAGLEIAMELLAVKPIRLILLTSMDEREAILDAFTIGVLNIVDKASYKDIPNAIWEAHRNQISIHPSAAALLRQEVSRLRQAELQRMLTPSEKLVLDLLIQGYTRKQIAEALNVTLNSVKFHVRGLIKKIGGKSGREAVRRGKSRGYPYS